MVKWAFQHKKLGICLRWKFLDPQKYIESSFSNTMNQCEIIHWHKSCKFHRRKLEYRRQPYWFRLFVNIAEFLLEGRCVTIYRSKSNRETNDTSFHYVPLDSLIRWDNVSSRIKKKNIFVAPRSHFTARWSFSFSRWNECFVHL